MAELSQQHAVLRASTGMPGGRREARFAAVFGDPDVGLQVSRAEVAKGKCPVYEIVVIALSHGCHRGDMLTRTKKP